MTTPDRPLPAVETATPAAQLAGDVQRRRRAVSRTAWVVGAIAIAVYVAFIASGVVAAGA